MSHIDLKLIAGVRQGQVHRFADRTTVLIGRSDSCQIQFPNDEDHSNISRYHCLLDLNPAANPPQACIRDFGSRNGTYVNGQKIGQRPTGEDPGQGRSQDYPECVLKHGDTIQLGNTTFEVSFGWEAKTPLVAPGLQERPQPLQLNLWERVQQLVHLAKGGDRE